jgi:hypothetical protein
VSELYRQIGVTDPYRRILAFVNRSRYFFFQVFVVVVVETPFYFKLV